VLPRFGMYTRRSGCGRRPRLPNRWMACHLAPGVVHFSPSTPGVRLPSFSDTRLTANALAENELTRNLCRAFTRRQFCSRVALAIRICSLLTGDNWTCRTAEEVIDAGQSPHVIVKLRPGDLVPVFHVTGGRRIRVHGSHTCLPPVEGIRHLLSPFHTTRKSAPLSGGTRCLLSG